MKVKQLRLTVLVLVLILILTLFSAQALFAAGNPEGSEAGGKLTIWCWDPAFNVYAMEEAARVYRTMHPDVTIEVVDIPDGIEAKIEAGLQARGAGLPDISLIQDFEIERFIQNYPGAFVDLKAKGIDYSRFAQYKLGPMTNNGSIYGIPFDTGSTGLFIRADMIKEAGLNPDDYKREMTWSEVIELGKKVKTATGKPFMTYDSNSYDFLRIMVQSTGAQFFDSEGNPVYDSPAVRKSLEYLIEMYENDLLYMAEGWDNWIAAFNGGKTAAFINGIWIIGTLKSQPENAGKWMVIPTPRIEGVPNARNASNNGGSSWYVFSTSRNQDLAADFLNTVWAGTSEAALEFYNTILKGAGAMGTFLPGRDGSNYSAPDEFFYNRQAVYGDFALWMESVPTLLYTPNYVSMRQALSNSMQRMFSGDLESIDAVLEASAVEYRQITGK